MLALEDVVLVDFVREEPQTLAPGELDHGLDPGARQHPPRGVVRRLEVERHRARGEARPHRLDQLLSAARPRKGTGTGAPWNERTMPAISGQ